MGDVIHAFAGIQRAVQGFPRSRGKCRQAKGVCRGDVNAITQDASSYNDESSE